jgi:hypothetical protein
MHFFKRAPAKEPKTKPSKVNPGLLAASNNQTISRKPSADPSFLALEFVLRRLSYLSSNIPVPGIAAAFGLLLRTVTNIRVRFSGLLDTLLAIAVSDLVDFRVCQRTPLLSNNSVIACISSCLLLRRCSKRKERSVRL